MRPAGLAFEEKRYINIKNLHPGPPPWPLFCYGTLSCQCLFSPAFHTHYCFCATGHAVVFYALTTCAFRNLKGSCLNIRCLQIEPWCWALQMADVFFFPVVPKDKWICNEITSIVIHIWTLWFHIPHVFPHYFILSLLSNMKRLHSVEHKNPCRKQHLMHYLYCELFMKWCLFSCKAGYLHHIE